MYLSFNLCASLHAFVNVRRELSWLFSESIINSEGYHAFCVDPKYIYFHLTMNGIKVIMLLIFSFLCHKLKAQDTLYWRATDTLAWSDFQGNPDRSARYLAISSTGISYTYRYSDSGIIYTVSACFVRSRSWRNYGTDLHVLKHEQGHFDITEIYARKLASQLKLIKPDKKTFRKTIETLGEKNISEKNNFQKKYDQETASGTKKRMQRKWEFIIRKQLDEELM